MLTTRAVGEAVREALTVFRKPHDMSGLHGLTKSWRITLRNGYPVLRRIRYADVETLQNPTGKKLRILKQASQL